MLNALLSIREPVNSWSHLSGAVLVAIGTYFLYKKGRGSGIRTSALMLFSAALLFLFSMSGIYHALEPGPWRKFFRQMDYAAIWLVIACTITPVQVLFLKGRWRWAPLSLLWPVTISGMLYVNYHLRELHYGTILGLFTLLSLIGFVSYYRIARRHGHKEAFLLVAGGAAYAVGALIDYFEGGYRLLGWFGPHELFHLMVMLGAGLNWMFIYARADRKVPRFRAVWRAARGFLAKLGAPKVSAASSS